MTLEYAQRCAVKILSWLTPICVRVEVAGSVRRRRAEVNDIDLVVIPNVSVETDLLGAVTGTANLTAVEVAGMAGLQGWTIDRSGPDLMTFTARGVQVDIWWATPESWVSVLVCRTGSKAHNMELAQEAQRLGYHWRTGQGLDVGGRFLPLRSEEEFFAALGKEYLPPELRDPPYWGGGGGA